ncbi:MAG: hypothetical protein AAFR87_09475, partial [Bacteroidota bacterium]
VLVCRSCKITLPYQANTLAHHYVLLFHPRLFDLEVFFVFGFNNYFFYIFEQLFCVIDDENFKIKQPGMK